MIPTGHRSQDGATSRGELIFWFLICSPLAIAGGALVRLTTIGYILSVLALLQCASQAAFGCVLGAFCCELQSWSRS